MSAPTAPLIKTNNRVFPSSIRFYWAPPVSSGDSPISSYTLSCSSISFQQSFPFSTYNFTPNFLPSSSNLIFQVFATNSNGSQGPPATYIPYQTGGPPAPPSNFSYSTIGFTSSINILWSTASSNSSALTYNAIWVYPIDSQSNTLSNLSSFTVKVNQFPSSNSAIIDLPSTDSNYKFIVRAVNSVGWSVDQSSRYASIILPRQFNPTNVSSIVFWIDPSVSSSYYAINSTIYEIDSLVNSNDSLLGSNGLSISSNVLNSRNVFSMDGSQFMSNTTVQFSTSGYTIFTLMFNNDSLNSYQRLINGSLLDQRLLIGKGNFSSLVGIVGNGTWGDTTPLTPYVSTLNSWRLFTYSYSNNTTAFAYSDGVQLNSRNQGSINFDGFIFGGSMDSSRWHGFAAETLIYPYVLAPFDRQKVEGYLAWKWGLQSQLPVFHPFKNIYPVQFSVFNPTLLSSLCLWLDASDLTTLTLNGISSVSQWRDKSGFNNHVSQAVANQQPMIYTSPNGLNGLYFSTSVGATNDTGGQWFRGTFATPITNNTLTAVVVLGLNNAAQQYGRALSLSSSNSNDFTSGAQGLNIARLAASNGLMMEANGGYSAYSPLSTFSTLAIAINTFDSGTQFQIVNNTTTNTRGFATNFNISRIGIGFQAFQGVNTSFDRWDGFINEVLVFNRYLSPDDRQSIEGYLGWKWGIQSNLPENHYYNAINPNTSTPLSIISTGLIVRFDASTYPGTGVWSNTGSLGTFFNASLYTGTAQKNAEGNGLYFDGNTSFTFSNISTQSSFTLSAWFKRTGLPSQFACIITDGSTGTSRMNMALQSSNASLSIQNTQIAGGFYNGTNWRIGSAVTFPLNEWHHMAVSFDSTSKVLATYYDGVRVNTTTYAGEFASTSGISYKIGQSWIDNTSQPKIIGEIGQILIYNRELSPAEVGLNYKLTRNTFSTSISPNNPIIKYFAPSFSTLAWSNSGTLGSGYTMTLSTGVLSTNSQSNGIVFNGSTSLIAISTGTTTYKNLSQYSMSMWFKRTSTTDAGGCVVAARFSTGSAFFLGRLSNDSINELRLGTFNGTTSTLATKYEFPDNAWVHMLNVHTNSNIATYINGSLIGAVSSIAINAYTGITFLGYNGTAAFVRGELGDLAIFNRPLTSRDAYLLYTSTYKTFPQAPNFRYTPSNFASGGPWSNNGTTSGTAYNAVVNSGTFALNSNSTALIFNNTSGFLTISSFSSLVNFTVSAWFKRSEIFTDTANIITDYYESSTGGNIGIALNSEGNNTAFRMGFHNNSGGWARGSLFPMERNKWILFTGTWDNTTKQMKTYGNGLLWETVTLTGRSPLMSGSNLRIGNYWFGDRLTLRGELGELMILNTPLSDQQVRDYYISTASIYPNFTPSTTLLLHYNVSSFGGSTWSNLGSLGSAYDAIYNSHSGSGISTLNSFSTGVAFNGNSFFRISSMSNTPKYTISAWVRRSAFMRTWTGLFTRQHDGGPWIDNFFGASGHTFFGTFLYYNTTATTAGNANAVSQYIWNHVTVTFDGLTFRYYTNGVQTGYTQTFNILNEAPSGNIPMFLGRGWNIGDVNNLFFGDIGELRFYNGALPSNDIFSIYRNTSTLYSNTNPYLSTSLLIQYTASNYPGTGPWSNTGLLGSYFNATVESGTPSKNGVGNGIFFNGSTNFHFSNIGVLPNFTAITWVKRVTSSLCVGSLGMILTQTYDGAFPHMNINLGATNYNNIPSTSIANGFYANGAWCHGTTVNLGYNVWTHVATSFNGSSLRTYVNGAFLGSVSQTNVTENNTMKYVIGRAWGGLSEYFRGEIGEIRIYSGPLSDSEVMQTYTTTSSIYLT